MRIGSSCQAGISESLVECRQRSNTVKAWPMPLLPRPTGWQLARKTATFRLHKPNFWRSCSNTGALKLNSSLLFALFNGTSRVTCLGNVYCGRLQPGSKCLELGAGAKSIVPVDRVGTVYGVGLLAEHMRLNAMLEGFDVMDLNTNSLELPLQVRCVCCLSSRYAQRYQTSSLPFVLLY